MRSMLAPPRLAPLLLHYYGSHLHGSHWLAPLLLHYYGSHLHGSHLYYYTTTARTSTARTGSHWLAPPRLAPRLLLHLYYTTTARTNNSWTDRRGYCCWSHPNQQQTGWQRILVLLLLEELHHWLLGDKCQPEPLGDK